MSSFSKFIAEILSEHQADVEQDDSLKKSFERILLMQLPVEETVTALFDAVQAHLKASGQQ